MSTLSLPIPTAIADVLPVSRSRSDDSTSVPNPPRYSTLPGMVPSNVFLNVTNNSTSNTNSQSRPPRYSSVFVETAEARRQGSGGSSNSRRRAEESGPRQSDAPLRTEYESRNMSRSVALSGAHKFEYYIRNNHKSAPWATLRVFSRSSASVSTMGTSGSSKSRVPKFTDSESLQGCLELNLESPQNINSIHLSLRGRVMTSAYDEGVCTFLEYPITVWTRAHGDPHTMLLNGDSRAKKFEGKLSGNYTWPFTFAFPSEVQLNGPHRTPPTFFDRKLMCSVQYDLVLKISHGMLRSDSKLTVDVAYTPDITPSPASFLRQVASGERIRAPGPDDDPVGWQIMAPMTLRGKIYNELPVKIQYTMSLASPQTYVRGSFIPFHLSFFCKDADALEMLIQPMNVVVRLTRKLQYYGDGGQTIVRGASSSSSRGEAQRAKLIEDVSHVGKAVWHPQIPDDDSLASNPYMRELSGEIHLEKDLFPSCNFPLLKASYTVDFCSFDTSKLKLSPSHQPLGSWPVTIATVHGEGPVPFACTEPPRPTRRHERSRSTVAADFAVQMGYGAISLG
ncbi:hypothetical protein CVT24_011874 [Panaeolus cyanescens]|uniref:Arrestin-like N-terminal domain-containing protein n=1 Tax=Panaeolus cyanescens TaxID=181874 RepID=A0A409YNV3_9AGAR|nr:hypothetical protein CVT24_011874 [Panaeolus cyanescens]